MGIYSSGDIYGIKIYLFNNDDDDENVLFEIKMDNIMSDEKKKEAIIFYNGLIRNDTTKVRFKIYTEASSTYNNEVFMMWEQITVDYFLQKFGI
jgi:hypothetical protein